MAADLCLENSYYACPCPDKALEFTLPEPPGCTRGLYSCTTGGPIAINDPLKNEYIALIVVFSVVLSLLLPVIWIVRKKQLCRKSGSHDISKDSRESNSSSHPLASVCVPCLLSSKSKKDENIQVETYTPKKEAKTYVSANQETPEDGLMKPMQRSEAYLESSEDYGEDQWDGGNGSLKKAVNNGPDPETNSEDLITTLSSDTSLVDELTNFMDLSVVLSDHKQDESTC